MSTTKRAVKNRAMTANQFRDSLETLGLTITGAAPYIGISPRQLQRIAAGSPVPGPARKLVRLALRHNIPLEDLADA